VTEEQRELLTKILDKVKDSPQTPCGPWGESSIDLFEQDEVEFATLWCMGGVQ
jgi:hypothetical protein